MEAIAAAARRSGAFFNQAAAGKQEVASETGRLGSEIANEGQRAGQMFGSAIRDAGQAATDYLDHRDISHGAVSYAGLNDTLTQQWNETAKNADPNDPTVAAKFREQVLEPELDKFRQGFTTEKSQAWAETRIDALRNHMFEKTAADMGTLAGQAVAVNVQQTSNKLSNTAMTDPSSVPHLLESVESSVGAMIDTSPNLKGADASKARMALTEKMKENIVKAGAIGAIQKAADPEAEAAKWGEQYPQYINGAELKVLGANARQQIRADRMDRAYADHLDKQAAQDKSDKVETGYLQKLYSDDPQVASTVSAKAIVNDPSLNRVAKERMVNVVNRELKPETDAKISAQTSVDVFRAMRDPNADPQKVTQMIYEARAKDPGTPGSMTKADMNDALKQLADLKTPEGLALASDRNEFFKRYAATIDPSMGDANSMQFGHHTALGMQKMYEAEKAVKREEDTLRKQGKDPHSLYDPSSPNFFGRPANLIKYQASMQDAAAYQANLSKNIAKPGDTVTGVDVKDAPPFKPPGNWQYSASRDQYRDPDGKLYDRSGKPVKQ